MPMVGGPQAGFAMAGDVDWTNGPRLRFGASLDPTPISVVARLWPSFLVAPVRSYLLDHVKQGIMQKGTMQFDFNAADLAAMRAEHPPPDGSLVIDFTVANGSVEFLRRDALTGIDGIGHVTGRTTTFTTTSVGMLDAGVGVLTAAAGGTFRIPDEAQKPTPAAIVTKVAGSVEAIGDLLSRDALKPYASLPLDRSTLKGAVDGQLEIDLNLKPDMGPADTTLKITPRSRISRRRIPRQGGARSGDPQCRRRSGPAQGERAGAHVRRARNGRVDAADRQERLCDRSSHNGRGGAGQTGP